MRTSEPDVFDGLVERVVRAADPVAVLRRLPRVVATADLARRLADEVPRRGRSSVPEAARLATAASWLARQSGNAYARGRAVRARGHVHSFGGRHRAALACYDGAVRLFERVNADLDVAITESGSLQSLIYTGEYVEAFARATRARGIFRRHGDEARLARLESNVGNIYFRQDRFEEALGCYTRALAGLRATGAAQDVAITLRNMATCLISLGRYDEALSVHEEAHRHCARERMPLLAAEADYNISYLYFLRGDYEQALDMYRRARVRSVEIGDRYHEALCDLDQAELRLELNDFGTAHALARGAAVSFERLGMRYERAKALAFLAIASDRLGDAAVSHRLFARAAALFVRERNRAWPALIDLYRGVALHRAGRSIEARRLAARAAKAFAGSALGSKAALAQVLLARIDLEDRRPRRALTRCRAALARLAIVDAPAVRWQALLALATTFEALGDDDAAYAAYCEARSGLERLRSHLRGDELKISFLTGKLAIYEGLVTMMLARGATPLREHAAFSFIEEAKSRACADLIAFRATSLPARDEAGEAAAAPVRAARRRLHWFDHQLERVSMRDSIDPARVERLRGEARLGERQLTDGLDGLRSIDAELAGLHAGSIVDIDAIRGALPAGTQLLEYYVGRGIVHACIVGRDRLEIHAVAPETEVRSVVRLLRFQLAKFRLHADYLRTFAQVLSDAIASHLQRLHDLLVAPLDDALDADHLVVVPHGVLHYVPFHALRDANVSMIDRWMISYAPSATVHHLCAARPRTGGRSLVLGVGDLLAPRISHEVEQVASILHDASLCLDADASAARLRRDGSAARVVHIATHGAFRLDNPMLSCIRLGDGELTVADIYSLRLSADLVTLSGCGTGLNVVAGGDEVVGLTRGLLYAGARAVMVSLWDVNDAATAELMTEFYGRYMDGMSAAAALAGAMRSVKARRPHPYYWAPFLLVGAPY
jgi:CHAT domain-containing protein